MTREVTMPTEKELEIMVASENLLKKHAPKGCFIFGSWAVRKAMIDQGKEVDWVPSDIDVCMPPGMDNDAFINKFSEGLYKVKGVRFQNKIVVNIRGYMKIEFIAHRENFFEKNCSDLVRFGYDCKDHHLVGKMPDLELETPRDVFYSYKNVQHYASIKNYVEKYKARGFVNWNILPSEKRESTYNVRNVGETFIHGLTKLSREDYLDKYIDPVLYTEGAYWQLYLCKHLFGDVTKSKKPGKCPVCRAEKIGKSISWKTEYKNDLEQFGVICKCGEKILSQDSHKENCLLEVVKCPIKGCCYRKIDHSKHCPLSSIIEDLTKKAMSVDKMDPGFMDYLKGIISVRDEDDLSDLDIRYDKLPESEIHVTTPIGILLSDEDETVDDESSSEEETISPRARVSPRRVPLPSSSEEDAEASLGHGEIRIPTIRAYPWPSSSDEDSDEEERTRIPRMNGTPVSTTSDAVTINPTFTAAIMNSVN